MTFNQINKLTISNFRNLKLGILEFSPKINLIFGKNGNGKTNLLEAIYFICTKKSFRKNNNFSHILNIDGDETHIEFQSLLENRKNDKVSYSAKIHNELGQWYLDNKQVKKKINIYPIFINPYDFYLFHQSASVRRSFFDDKISLVNKKYKISLKKYQKIIRIRNKLLSEKSFDYLRQIKINDEELINEGEYLTFVRTEFLRNLEVHLNQTFKHLFHNSDLLEIKLDSKLNKENFREIISRNFERDLKAGMTTYGIHKDDYMLLFNGFNSLEFCSLGQQKMSYLSLQFSFIELFKCNFAIYPIVLIDDISGELDKVRWNHLISFLSERNFQTFITTANEDFKNILLDVFKIKSFIVEDGLIQEE